MRLKQWIFGAGLLLLLCCFAGSVLAENMAGGITISPSAGMSWFDSDYDVQDNGNIGLAISSNITENWTLEGGLNYTDSSRKVTVLPIKEDVKIYFYHVDGLYHFLPQQQFVPFLAAGVGGLAFDNDRTGSDNDFAVNYGAGFKIFPVDRVILRGDFRHVITRGEDSKDDSKMFMNYLATIGLSYQFGGSKAEVPDGDADGDGVKDSMDKCPGTPPGSIVNAQGCVADSDGDGVIDAQDKCPDTPRGIKVDEQGCPFPPPVGDSDNDGVKDDVDQCPDTPSGASVNVNGCWIVKNLLFDINKSTIKPESKAGLDEVVAIMKKNPDLKAEIQGHTDNTGSLKLNESLSYNRAMAVKDYLVAAGIEGDRMKTVGFAFTKPAVSNDTVEGRAQNRRVELHRLK